MRPAYSRLLVALCVIALSSGSDAAGYRHSREAGALESRQATSELRVCNETRGTIWVAHVYPDGAEFYSEGWWGIGRGQCVTTLANVMGAVWGYVTLEDGSSLTVGTTQDMKFCIDRDRRFRLSGGDCNARPGMEWVKFGLLADLSVHPRSLLTVRLPGARGGGRPAPRSARCYLPMPRRPQEACKANREAYYYDQKARRCRGFSWGGCIDVPFTSYDECAAACEGR